MFRFSLKHILLATTLIAICAAAISIGSWFWTRLVFTLALSINLGAILASIYLRGKARAFWIGFAMFGWTSWLISNYPLLQIAEYQMFVNEIATVLKEHTPEANNGHVILHKTHSIAIFSFERTIHVVFGLIFAVLGGTLGYWVCGSQGDAQGIGD